MTKKLLFVILITVALCTISWSIARPAQSRDAWTRENLKVLKVFSARDGDAMYREYLVNYKDQEVVVQDPLLKTNYQVGDVMPVLVMKHKYPQGKQGPDLLSFLEADH